MRRTSGENGAALIVILGFMALMSFLALSTFRWSMDELKMAAGETAGLQSQYLAESGVALILQAFHEPGGFPAQGVFLRGFPETDRASFLAKRMRGPAGGSFHVGPDGRSQFTGSEAEPDYLYEDPLGNGDFLGADLRPFGHIEFIKLYAPGQPGAVSTVMASGHSRGGGRRVVRVHLAPGALPPVTAAVQTSAGDGHPVPVRVHWGDVRAGGDMDIGNLLEAIPVKDASIIEDGTPYGPGERRDGWVDFIAGGAILRPAPSSCPACEEPFETEGHGNIHQFQADHPDRFRLDTWDYERLKALAKEYGTYYGTDAEGNLYWDGIEDAAHRRSPIEGIADGIRNGRLRLVFIDTVDGLAPGGGNLADLVLPVDHGQGYLFIHADVTIRPGGPGQTVFAKTPPSEGSEDASTRREITLSGIHFEGILSVAGRLTVEGAPRVYGAILAGEGFGGDGEMEVWYNADWAAGNYSGLPVVSIMKGGWYME